MKIVSKNPANNYEVIGEVEETAKEEVLEKLKLAKSVQKDWANLELSKRIEIVNDLYDKFKDNAEDMANLITLEMGKPITQSEAELAKALDYMKWDLDNAIKCLSPEISFETDVEIHKVFYDPKGIVLSITPFNYPFSQFIWHTIQNLLVGNVVISKPDPNLPLFTKLLEEIVSSSKLPESVLQFVYGGREIGQFLAEQDFDAICFTGNTKTGKYLYGVAASKMIPILMELGGSAPGIICEDADVDKVIAKVFNSRFTNCGQLCHALKRLIVHESKFDEVVERLKNIVLKQIVGDPTDKNTTMGSLVSETQLDRLQEQLNDALDKGAKIIYGGRQPEGLEGAYFEPTLLINITYDMKVWKEEVFGPILPIVTFKTIDEAIELANDTIYGLGAYVYTTNKNIYEDISKRLNSCMVSCNGLNYSTAFNPFGGVKASGNGRVRGKWGFRELCNIKIVTFEK